MQREVIRQRIHYLLEHGGLHQPEPADRRHTVMMGLLVLIALAQVVLLFNLLE